MILVAAAPVRAFLLPLPSVRPGCGGEHMATFSLRRDADAPADASAGLTTSASACDASHLITTTIFRGLRE